MKLRLSTNKAEWRLYHLVIEWPFSYIFIAFKHTTCAEIFISFVPCMGIPGLLVSLNGATLLLGKFRKENFSLFKEELLYCGKSLAAYNGFGLSFSIDDFLINFGKNCLW